MHRILHMAELKIGYLAQQLSSGAGTDRYARSLSEALAAHATVRMLTMRSAHNDTTLTDVRAVLPPPNFHPVTQLKVAWHVMRHLRRCDVIHSLIEHYGPGLAIAGFLLRIPVTMTLHGTYSVPSQHGLKHLLMRFMYRHMPLTTTGSYYTAQKTAEVVPLEECRIIPNGVNIERFHVLPGIRKEELMLTVGALKARKGVDVTLQALAKLKDLCPSLRYGVVGDDADDAFCRKVHAMVDELGLTGRVNFYEKISDEELVQLYNRAKLFVLSARHTSDGAFEGFPMVFYEANGCGTPVITTTGFGSEYAIHDGQNGYLVPPEDPDALAQAISRLLGDEKQYAIMSEQSVAEARAHVWERIAETLLVFYKDVIKRA